MGDLFDDAADRLLAAGCQRAGKAMVGNVPLWKLPDGRVVEQAAALRWLNDKEAKR